MAHGNRAGHDGTREADHTIGVMRAVASVGESSGMPSDADSQRLILPQPDPPFRGEIDVGHAHLRTDSDGLW
jgi:hypothetical protein